MPRGGIKKTKKHRSRSKSGVALCHGVPPSRSLLAPFPHSLLLNRTETLATRAKADRESSVTLCHGVALKKKRDRGPREPRRSVPRGGVKKKKVERDRSRTERAVSLCATGWR